MSDNWLHEMERAEEGFARRKAQAGDCPPGQHLWARTRNGGGVCRHCQTQVDPEEL